MAEVKHFNTSNSKKPLDIDWRLLLDDTADDRPPGIVISPAEKSKGRSGDLQQPEMEEKEDTEYKVKTDGELEGMISRTKHNILKLGPKLPDKGENLKATLRRYTAEVERRKRSRANKGGNRCKETLQLSDKSDDDNQKPSASPDFTKLFSQNLDEDKSSRTVNAFQDESSFFNFQGKKMKQNCQQLPSRSKQFKCSSSLRKDFEKEKQRMSNADKKVNNLFINKPGSSLKAHAPSNQPSRKLKPTNGSGYHLVDEEPIAENLDDWAHVPKNPPSKKSRPKHAVSAYCLVDEDPLPETFDWVPVSQSPPSRKLRPRYPSTYNLVDDDLIADKLDDCMQDIIVYYPSRVDQDSVEVTYQDTSCLAPQVYLSSAIMNFYIRYLQQMTSSENIIGNFHFFNTYFYNKLQKLNYKEDSFVKFRKWWKGVNLFEKAYILLPVHDMSHWSLGIICIPKKEDELGAIVLHLDSLGLHDSTSIFDNIKRFVKEEWSYLKNSEDFLNLPITDKIWEDFDHKMDEKRVMVPQQRNEYDCGLFVLYYMECFIKEAPERFKEEHLSMFSKQWFRPQEASNLRTRIHNLLVQEFKITKEKEKENISSPNSC